MPLEQLAKSNSQNGDEIRFLKDDFFHLPVPHWFYFSGSLGRLGNTPPSASFVPPSSGAARRGPWAALRCGAAAVKAGNSWQARSAGERPRINRQVDLETPGIGQLQHQAHLRECGHCGEQKRADRGRQSFARFQPFATTSCAHEFTAS
jgi:hypothetical protein